ncbi:MAG: hypothetical protein ACHQUB_02010 [Candidatus Saccharimonadia bacterium]
MSCPIACEHEKCQAYERADFGVIHAHGPKHENVVSQILYVDPITQGVFDVTLRQAEFLSLATRSDVIAWLTEHDFLPIAVILPSNPS